MYADLKKMGENPDRKCLKSMADSFSVTGGASGDPGICYDKPSAQEQKRADLLEEGRRAMGHGLDKALGRTRGKDQGRVVGRLG